MNTVSAPYRRVSAANRHLVCAGLIAASVLLFYLPLRLLLSGALDTDEYSHILAVPLISAWFFRARYRETGSQARYDRAAGLLLMTIGLSAYAMSRLMPALRNASDWLTISMTGIVLVWIGSLVTCYGLRVCRAAAFPVLLLFLMVPIPTVVVHWAVVGLQQLSTTASEVLFRVLGVPVLRQGTVISMPQLSIEVSEACSGIRSSIAMVLTVLVLGYVALRRSSHRVLLLLCTVPLAVLKNAVRIVVLSLLAIHIDPSFLTGNLHHEGGFVFYLIGLALLWPILWGLQRLERHADREKTLAAAAN